MKALVGAFNQEKALVVVGAFSVIVKTDCETDGSFYSTSTSQSRNSAAAARLKSLLIVPRDARAELGRDTIQAADTQSGVLVLMFYNLNIDVQINIHKIRTKETSQFITSIFY